MVIIYTLPVWAALLAWPMLGERPTMLKVFALVLALGGVVLLVGADTAEASWQKLPGAILGVAAAMPVRPGYGAGEEKPLRLPPTTSVAWQGLLGIAVVATLALFEHPHYAQVTAWGWASLAYISTIPHDDRLSGLVPGAAVGASLDRGNDCAGVASGRRNRVGVAAGRDVRPAPGCGLADDPYWGGAGSPGVAHPATSAERSRICCRAGRRRRSSSRWMADKRNR